MRGASWVSTADERVPETRLPRARRSRFWAAFFPAWYRLVRLGEPFLRRWLTHRALGDTVELTVRGRRSGLSRHVLLGLLSVDGVCYLGHPAGVAAWTANLVAADGARVAIPNREPMTVRATLVEDVFERERVIRATFRQHPFPGNVVYWLARDHIRAVGRFYRLEVVDG